MTWRRWRSTGVGRDINRHYYTRDEIERELMGSETIWAVVIGASSGLGVELAAQLAHRKMAGVEQIGASFSLFAARYTDRNILGREIPAGVLLTVNRIFVIAFSPVFAAVWLSLGKRGKDFSPPAKFAAGLILMGLGFLPMYFASHYVMAGAKVSPLWLIGTYLLHTWGELCLSPVGISSMTKPSPPPHIGQVLGMWFLAVALGNNLAGQLSGLYDANVLESLPGLFIRSSGGVSFAVGYFCY